MEQLKQYHPQKVHHNNIEKSKYTPYLSQLSKYIINEQIE